MIAEILRELIAAGLQGESLVAAVERIEQAQPKAIDATAERRRAKDRERYHLRKPPNPTETTVSTGDGKPSLSSLLSSSESTTKPEESKKKERARKSQLPADWTPKPAHYAKAAALGKPQSFVDEKADDLRNWAASKAIIRANWDATFFGFLKPKEGLNGHHRETLDDRAARLVDRARQLEFEAGVGRPDEPFGIAASGEGFDPSVPERRR